MNQKTSPWVQVVVTVLTVLGSIVVAWLTTGAKFEQQLNGSHEAVVKLRENMDRLQTDVEGLREDVTRARESVKPIDELLRSVHLQSRWRILYEHDRDGVKLSGSLEDLITAVRQGLPVRVRISGSEGPLAFDADWAWISGSTVYAQNTRQIAVGDDDRGNVVHQENAYHFFLLVSSTGMSHVARWSVGEHANRGGELRRYAAAWFAPLP